jgi:23S rRNA pseudouridine1911/1915/1917 synthase
MLAILLDDNHCLALNKPAGLLTQGDITGESNLFDQAKGYLRVHYSKPGNVYLGLLHRLDRPVSGAVLFAKTSKAAARLSEQFRTGAVEKVYMAVVAGTIHDSAGEWVDWLRKDETRNVVKVVGAGAAGAKEARLAFRVLEQHARTTLMELHPHTGRSHQLRVQLAARGLPILGDRKYGSHAIVRALDGGLRIALHAQRLTFTHPTRPEAISVVAPVPADWPAYGQVG